jgi:drug/metabolite transporter (DMT)-like permease
MSNIAYGKAIAYLASAQLLIALNIVSAKYSLQFISPNVYLGWRYFFAFLCSLIFLFFHQRPKIFGKLNLPIILLQAVSGGILFNIPMSQGLVLTDASIAGIITSLLPIITLFLSWILFKTKLTPKNFIAISFSVMGLLFISMGQLAGQKPVHTFLGDLWIFLAIIPEALYYLLSHRYRPPISDFFNASIIFSINSFLFLIILFWQHADLFHIPLKILFLIMFQGFSLSLYYLIWLKGCQIANETLITVSASFMPVMTVILAMLFLHEHLNLYQCLGILIILMTVIFQKKQSLS